MDRLVDLKRKSVAIEEVAIDITDPEKGLVSGQGADNEFMQSFFNDVELVKQNIAAIKEASRRIAQINQNVVQAANMDKELEKSSELEPLIKQTNTNAKIAKQLLQRMREETDRLKTTATAETSKQTPEVRIRENLNNTLTRKFVDVMKEYQNAQTKYKTDIKKKVKRQVQIVKPDATSEEIDAVFKSGGGSGEVYKNAILTGEAADSIRNAYMNVVDKYHDVITLEASVAELHQMFLDFALLTEKQGELLDQIEHQVKEASEYVEQGNKEITEAIELQKSVRYKQCLCIVIVLVIIGIVAGIIAAKVSGAL